MHYITEIKINQFKLILRDKIITTENEYNGHLNHKQEIGIKTEVNFPFVL